jgi:diguanylate cyclase (GGDEF)-like protein
MAIGPGYFPGFYFANEPLIPSYEGDTRMNNLAIFAVLTILAIAQAYTIYRLLQERNRYRLLSITDGLTGLANWRHASMVGQQLLEKGGAVGIVILDLDRFKEINDTFGHIAGNKVLMQVAQLLQEAIPPALGLVCRIGGDEFVIILPNCQRAEVYKLREQLAVKLGGALKVVHDLPLITVTASFGVAYSPSQAVIGFEDLIQIADKSMYDTKACGLNG